MVRTPDNDISITVTNGNLVRKHLINMNQRLNQGRKENRPTVSRRKVLGGIAAGAGGVITLSTSGAGAPDGDYVGFSYDTLTHQVAGRVNADLHTEGDQLRGQLNIAGFDIPVNKLRRTRNPSREEFRAVLTENGFVKDSRGLKVKLTKFEDQYAGTATRPGSKHGILGFTLRSADSRSDIDREMNQMVPDKNWVESNHSFTLKQKGIPTDTGVERLAKNAIENRKNRGGGE